MFLEYGIRLAVRDSLNIMISHEKVVLPFDIQDLRCIRYSLSIQGANKARDEIAEFIRGYLSQLNSNAASLESSDFYKRYVDLYSGRQLERELVSALETAPKLVADLAGFLLTGKKDPTLKQKVFKFFEAVEKVLRTDPKGIGAQLNTLNLSAISKACLRRNCKKHTTRCGSFVIQMTISKNRQHSTLKGLKS